MADTSSPQNALLEAVTKKLARLSLQREQVLRQLAEVDAQIAAVADALGLDPVEVAAAPPGPPMVNARSDRRRAGSMVEFAVNTIADHMEGITRAELKRIIGQHDEFGAKLRGNPNHFYNFIKRSIDRGELDEKHGRLWLAGRAPDDAPQFRGQTLFTAGGGNA